MTRVYKCKKGIKITPEIIKEMIRLYNNGKSTVEISKILNCSSGAVWVHIAKNIRMRTQGEGSSLKWKNNEWKQNQIKKRMGKSSGAMGKRWKLEHRKFTGLYGSRNHFWKGGKTKLSLAIRMLPEYSYWRKSVFERDNWCCILCKRKRIMGDRVILQADHIIPLWKIIKQYKLHSLIEAISCKELWNISNGRTLCKECHKKTETYGVNING